MFGVSSIRAFTLFDSMLTGRAAHEALWIYSSFCFHASIIQTRNKKATIILINLVLTINSRRATISRVAFF